jgi:hypothetical protein
VRKQTALDSSVKGLAEAMVNLFSWVKETESLDDKISRFDKIIELMAQQATECSVFIKDYASRGFLGMCTAFVNILLIDNVHYNRANSAL